MGLLRAGSSERWGAKEGKGKIEEMGSSGGAREERETRGRDGDRALRLGLEGHRLGLGPA